MQTCKTHITKEVYEKVKDMNHSDLYKYFDNSKTSPLSMAILCGYGFYGISKVTEENGEYFAEITIGSTCD